MDPLTHTLVGASLAATRLGKTTRRAVPALVIGANLPDVDVLSYFAGSDAALGFRRGWTHGVLALAVLPAVLALLLWAWDRRRQPESQALSFGWLTTLCYIGVVSHPFLDWLNTYGMRWWMPFDGTWYYGDAVFIIDPWIWLALGSGFLLGRRPSRRLVGAWAVVTVLLLMVVARRAPEFTLVVIAVLAILLLAIVWKPAGERFASSAAAVGLILTALFISAMLATRGITEKVVREELDRAGIRPVDQIMIGPTPINPFTWEFVVRANGRLRHGRLSWIGDDAFQLSGFDRGDARKSDRWTEIEASDQVPGFLDWARFPWLASPRLDAGGRVHILDARYARTVTSGFGGAVVHLPEDRRTPADTAPSPTIR